MAEVLTLRDSIFLAHNLGLEWVMLESDNLSLIQACRGERKIGEIAAIVKDITWIKEKFARCEFTWTKREGNELAHAAAALHEIHCLRDDWTLSPPPNITRLLQSDMHRWCCLRSGVNPHRS